MTESYEVVTAPVTRDAESLLHTVAITSTYAAAAFAAGDYEQVVRIADRPPGWRQVVEMGATDRPELLPYYGQHAAFLVQVGLSKLALGHNDEAEEALTRAQDLVAAAREQATTFAGLSPCGKHGNMVPYGVCREPPCYA